MQLLVFLLALAHTVLSKLMSYAKIDNGHRLGTTTPRKSTILPFAISPFQIEGKANNLKCWSSCRFRWNLPFVDAKMTSIYKGSHLLSKNDLKFAFFAEFVV